MIAIEILIEPRIQTQHGRAIGRRALGALAAEAARAVKLKGAVSVLLTGDGAIRRLNREFRKKDKATDVLSFPAAAGRAVAGDVAISVETAARQAREQGHALAAELRILVLHGLLHLAGFDHESDTGEMARKEAALRRRFGLGAGLIERSEGETTPQRRKPRSARGLNGRAEAVPLQSRLGSEGLRTAVSLASGSRRKSGGGR